MGRTLACMIFCFVTITTNLYGQDNGIIKGVVKDIQGMVPLTGANVYIKDSQTGSSTNNSGEYEIGKIPAGTYTIICSFMGYSKVEKVVIIKSGEVTILDFTLEQEMLKTGEIVVSREMLLGGIGKIDGIPGSAYYIGKTELSKFGYDDIHRVLSKIPGINIQEEDGYGLRPNIGMRGTGVERSQKISLMEDGVLIAPAPYSAPAAYYFPSVGRMEAIEIRKGSSQIKYGPYTTGGALNLISTRIPFEFNGYLNITAGENNEHGIHAYAGDSYKNFGYLVETYQKKVNGFKNLDGGGSTGFDKKDYMVKIRFNSNPGAKYYNSLTLKIGQTEEESNETYLGLTEEDFAVTPYRRYSASQLDVINANHEQFTATYFLKLSESFDISSIFYRNEFSRNWYKLDRVASGIDGKKEKINAILENPEFFSDEYNILTGSAGSADNALDVKANNRNYTSTGFQTILGLESGSEETTLHQIEIGFRYHKDEVDRFQWVDTYSMDNGIMKLNRAGVKGTDSNRIGTAKSFATFLQYKYRRNKISVVPGIRYENMNLARIDFGKADPSRSGVNIKSNLNKVDVWIPGIGFDIELNPNINSFFGVHKGFSPPGSKNGTNPEISINYEIGTRFNFSNFQTSAVLFFNDYENLLGSDLAGAGGSGSGDLINGGTADVSGLEFSTSFDFSRLFGRNRFSMPLEFNYTYTKALFKNEFQSDYNPWGAVKKGDHLPYIPNNQLSISFSVIQLPGKAQAKWNLNVTGKYSGKMRTVAGQGPFNVSQSTGSRFIADISAQYSLTNDIKFMMTVKNLTNRVYIAARRPAGLRPGLPRTFKFGLITDF